MFAGFRPPSSMDEITAFLLQSAQQYRPLPSLPATRPMHKRQSSRSSSRLSPYGLPLPREVDPDAPKPKKMSIPTKYERTNSIGAVSIASTRHNLEDTRPSSALSTATGGIFARFVPDQQRPRPQTQRKNGSLPPRPGHPLHLADANVYAHQPRSAVPAMVTVTKKETEKRVRVPSATRRQNLGWGKRKESGAKEQPVPELPGAVRTAVLRLEEQAKLKQTESGAQRKSVAVSGYKGKGKASGGDKENQLIKKIS